MKLALIKTSTSICWILFSVPVQKYTLTGQKSIKGPAHRRMKQTTITNSSWSVVSLTCLGWWEKDRAHKNRKNIQTPQFDLNPGPHCNAGSRQTSTLLCHLQSQHYGKKKKIEVPKAKLIVTNCSFCPDSCLGITSFFKLQQNQTGS